MNILRSTEPHIESPIAVYQKTLSRHKHLIQSNRYAQELEKKYNKYRHKSQQESSPVHRSAAVPHLWPIHSIVFTEVLRNKLDTVLKSSTPKSSTRPSTRLRFTTPKNSLNSTRKMSERLKTSIPLDHRLASLKISQFSDIHHLLQSKT